MAFYSKSTKGFYEDRESAPKDAVEITDEYKAQLLLGEAMGKIISSDNKGRPVLTDAPPPSAEQVLIVETAKLAELKKTADSQKSAISERISVIQDSVDFKEVEGMEAYSATPEEEDELHIRKHQLVQWKAYAILLGRVQLQDGWPSSYELPAAPGDGMTII